MCIFFCVFFSMCYLYFSSDSSHKLTGKFFSDVFRMKSSSAVFSPEYLNYILGKQTTSFPWFHAERMSIHSVCLCVSQSTGLRSLAFNPLASFLSWTRDVKIPKIILLQVLWKWKTAYSGKICQYAVRTFWSCKGF